MKKYKFKIRGNKYDTVIKSYENNIIEIDVNGTHYQVELEKEVIKTKTPKLVRARVQTSKTDAKITSKKSKLIKAPLPGTIIKLNVKIGDVVKLGDTLLIMEAMKMENNIQSESDGIVKTIMVREGGSVLQNDILLELG